MTKTSEQKSPNAEGAKTLSASALLLKLLKIYTHKKHQRKKLHHQVLYLTPIYIKCHETIGYN